MIKIHQLTFGPFSENTYLLANEEDEAIIVDPGMYYPEENSKMFDYLNAQGLKPVRLILTHAHLDHVFGVNWISNTYGLVPEVHIDDQSIYNSAVATAMNYGLAMEKLVEPTIGLDDGSQFTFGNSVISIFQAPGHSPGSVCFYIKEENALIGGDVIFQGSIGRTDLPGGDVDTLINAIKTKVLVLPDETIIYSGHGPITTVGQERISNPFLT
jgi:glyoxylase-like metal-dependent hydrolase (beta-lactamase superfamily II)